jgi:hypothetical protein
MQGFGSCVSLANSTPVSYINSFIVLVESREKTESQYFCNRILIGMLCAGYQWPADQTRNFVPASGRQPLIIILISAKSYIKLPDAPGFIPWLAPTTT